MYANKLSQTYTVVTGTACAHKDPNTHSLLQAHTTKYNQKCYSCTCTGAHTNTHHPNLDTPPHCPAQRGHRVTQSFYDNY